MMIPATILALAFWQQPSPPVFEAEANLVLIDAQVLDKDTRQPIRGLTRADFVVLDESAPSEIVVFDNSPAPLNILLLLDVSGGFTNEGVLYCTDSFLSLRQPDDRIALVSFSDGDAKRRTTFTNDEGEIQRARKEIFDVDRNNSRRHVKNSRIFDAIRSGVNLFFESPKMRRPVMLVVTHNREKRSVAKQQAVIDALLESSVKLEAITIPQETVRFRFSLKGTFVGMPPDRTRPAPKPPEFLEDLHSVEPIAAATGGQTVHLDFANASRAPRGASIERGWNTSEVARILDERIMGRLRSQYTLGVRGASMPDGTQFRRLDVRLTEAARQRYPNAVVSARSGYFTIGPTGHTKTTK